MTKVKTPKPDIGTATKPGKLSRRSLLGMMGATAGGLVAGNRPAAAQSPASPAVRKKVKIVYWNWADNPNHLKISTDSVDMFNKSQNLIEVELDANMAVG